jgi:small subunit ribosomal protein S17
MATVKKQTKKKAEIVEATTDCQDKNCPVHGRLSTRGMVLDGVVASDKMNKTVVVQRNYYVKLKKYERYRPKKSRIPAHNPTCINAKTGDTVRIMECRKLSSTVSFVVIEKLKEAEAKN